MNFYNADIVLLEAPFLIYIYAMWYVDQREWKFHQVE